MQRSLMCRCSLSAAVNLLRGAQLRLMTRRSWCRWSRRADGVLGAGAVRAATRQHRDGVHVCRFA
eukprot:7378188-Prymnesium_polylepis.1